MTRGEIDVLPEILFSQQTKKQFSRVLGFDLGSSALSCSLSNDKTPITATVFQDWANGSKNEPLFPSCIQYKNWSKTTDCNNIKIGFDGRPEENPLDEGDLYIPSIKRHVIQWIQQGTQDDQPDALLVLSDFFKATRTHFENAFKRFNEKLDKTQEQKQKACNPKTAAATKHYSLGDCRFSFAVPDGLACKSEYTNLIRKAFVQAGFLKQEDVANRLIFVSDAVAAGYSCVHAPQNFSGIELDTNYLVADLGYDSTKIAIVQAQKTAATSTVLPSAHETAIAGYGSFSDNFRKYITERSDTFNLDATQPEKVDLFVAAFETYKTSNIDLNNDTGETEFTVNNEPVIISNRDLREHVFKPYLDDIFSLVFKHCQTYRIAKIFFRGQYCQDPYFDKACSNFVTDGQYSFHRIPRCFVWGKEPEYMISNGAVSYGLRSALVQVPLFKPTETPANQSDESSKVQKTKDSTTSSDKFSHLDLPKGHFAVGIDFGTTFSGCSYADISKMKPGEKRAIETIDVWDKASTYPKISTALRYNQSSGKFSKFWGFDALKAKNEMKPGDLKLQYFKLLLSPENVKRFYGNGNREIRDVQDQLYMVDLSSNGNRQAGNSKALTPVDIIAKYLKYFNSRIKEHLEKKTGIKAKSLKLKYVITVPAMWTDTGRATMIEAAIQAGLVKSNEGKYIQLITEPEAAALSCEKFMKDTLKLNSAFYEEELVFTVFDAGGGTVDLVTFKQTIGKTEDGKEERSIKQIGDGNGDTCGAAYLDTRFKEAIIDFYNDTMGQRIKGEGFFNYHVEYFKENIKKNFMPSSRTDAVYRIPLPALPEIPLDTKPKPYGESNDPSRPKLKCSLIDKNTVLEISVAEIKRCIFDPIVDKAVDVLKTHLEKTSNNRPSAILMVGGFSQSKYLKQRIQSFCLQEDIPHVSAPPKGVTAISRGAVSYFLEPRLVSRKIASSSYALCVDLANKSNNASHLCYFIRKGASIEVEEKLYTKTVSVMYPGSAVIALFAHDEPEGKAADEVESVGKCKKEVEPYTSNDGKNVKKVAEYVIDLPDSPLLSPGTMVDLQVSFKTAIDGVSLDIKSVDDRIGLQTSGQTDEKCISFKRIEMDPLKINLNKEGLQRMSIFGISFSKGG
ncbi:uncharacterized protein ATC70_009517 [Mucor velutinosus]|uniref:Uncharacterized protein n=1 Tax=Mucor velutinosus TaxID=708070 RepID=A0AAN7DQX1_9FUNG|nr:hypothetical protein ATC70_009517 [Mucor velutinosus]